MPGCILPSAKRAQRTLSAARDVCLRARRCLVAVAVNMLVIGSAASATSGTCTILVASPGILAPNPSLTSLSTQNPGGAPARVSVTAQAGGVLPFLVCSLGLPLNCMKVTVTNPSSFTSAPSSGGANVTLASMFSVVGSGSQFNLLGVVILNGTTLFNFDLVATKQTGTFAAGSYTATETITCE